MKGLGKILFGCSVLTGALLLYVHTQVEILKVSYRIQAKSSQFSSQTEQYRQLKFEVSRLRSPETLEKRLGSLSLDLTLPKQIQVLRVPAVSVPPAANPLPLHTPADRLFDFFGQWIQIAQARTEQ